MRHVLATIIAAIGIAMCALAPAYADTASTGEFRTAQTGEGEYAVIMRGDRSMDRREVAEQAMLHAAEVTLQQGFEWFMVTSNLTQRIDLQTAASLTELDNAGVNVRDAGAGQGAGADASGSGGGGNSATAGVDPGAVGVGTSVDPRLLERRRPRMAYQTILMIKVGRGHEVQVEDPAHVGEIFDAASIRSQLNN
jgi:hypothetical protein